MTAFGHDHRVDIQDREGKPYLGKAGRAFSRYSQSGQIESM